jgi:CRP-like cAMP-binding protein
LRQRRYDRAVPPLDDHPLFAGLSVERRARLVAEGAARSYPAGAVILTDGQEAEEVYALLRGRVRVFHSAPSGAEIVVKAFSAPALFGEAEALAGIQYLESVAALTEVELLGIPRQRFAALVREEPALAAALCFDLAARLAISSYDEKSIAFYPATVRLANYLLDYADWIGDGNGELKVDLTQDDMAKAIGVTRRSIAKDVALWQKERILRRTDGGYRVVDPEGLRRYADEQRLKLHYSLAHGHLLSVTTQVKRR